MRALGGSVNAGTYYEDTTYYITVPSANTESAVEILSDMVRNSLIDSKELAKELEVIIQESKQKRDNPGAMLYETMYAHAFDRHRIRRWRIGEDETLRSFRRDDLMEFMAQTYVPDNMVLSIVGDVDWKEALAAAERHWGDMEHRPLRKELVNGADGGHTATEAGPLQLAPDRDVHFARQRGARDLHRDAVGEPEGATSDTDRRCARIVDL